MIDIAVSGASVGAGASLVVLFCAATMQRSNGRRHSRYRQAAWLWPTRLVHPHRSRRRRTQMRHSLLLLGGLCSVFVLGPLGTLALAVIIATMRAWRRLRSERSTIAATRRQLPDAVDVIVLGIRAGLTPVHAFAELGPTLPPLLAAHFAAVTVRHQHGERFADALDALHEAPEDMLRPLATALARAERYGEPLAPVLDRLADESRRSRRRQAEASARQLPVRMCFPLACCTLPAFVLLTIVPLLAGTFTSIRGNVP